MVEIDKDNLWLEYNKLEDQISQIASEFNLSKAELKQVTNVQKYEVRFKVLRILKAQLQILIKINEYELKYICAQPVVDLNYYRQHFCD